VQRFIDLGVLDGRPFVNLVSGGFGSGVTGETDPELKSRLDGLAYVITGVSRFAELWVTRGRFRAGGFSWEGPVMALPNRQRSAGRRLRVADGRAKGGRMRGRPLVSGAPPG
jgi:diacylglycerol kinase family enzyme